MDMNELFGQPYNEQDPHWVVMGYFDSIYSRGYLLESIALIVKRWGFCADGAYCSFPDRNSLFEEEHFDGVEFAYGYPPTDETTIVVSETTCSEYVRLACQKYLQRHPDDRKEVETLLEHLPF